MNFQIPILFCRRSQWVHTVHGVLGVLRIHITRPSLLRSHHKPEERMPHDPRTPMRDSRFGQKFQPGFAQPFTHDSCNHSTTEARHPLLGSCASLELPLVEYTESPHSRSECPPTPGTLWETVVFTKNSNRLSLIDSPMADSPIERRPRGMPDLGLSRIFKHFSTFTQSHHTRGVSVPRPQERYGR